MKIAKLLTEAVVDSLVTYRQKRFSDGDLLLKEDCRWTVGDLGASSAPQARRSIRLLLFFNVGSPLTKQNTIIHINITARFY